ncbi:MAG: XkdF-like putative serine protease domain-containing protein [Candidatus Paceibacterota bacterium]
MNVKLFNGLPLFAMEIDLTNQETGLSCISFVDKPATEIEMLAFDNQEKELKFSIQDKQIIVAPVMVANKPIYRRNNTIGEHYVVYKPDTIRQMQIKYFQDNLHHAFTENHDGTPIKNATMFENWLIENENDKAYTQYGFSIDALPVGSWVCSIYFGDSKYWNDIIKTGKFGGISLEGLFIYTMNYKKEEESLDQKILNALYSAFEKDLSDEEIIEILKKLNK